VTRSIFQRSQWPTESTAFLIAAGLAIALSLPASDGIGLWQAGLLALAVVILGLPHGALDPWIARHRGLMQSTWLFAGQYAGLALLVVAIWWLIPVASLAAFLLFSAWHFAQDWHRVLPASQRGAVGLGLLALPAFAHPEQVGLVFGLIASPQAVWLGQALNLVAWVTTPLMLLIATVLGSQARWSSSMEIVVLIVLAWLTPVLVYFIIYFCFLHSPRHLRLALEGIEGSERNAAILSAAGYTAVTLIFAIPFALILFSINDPEQALLQVVFIGLAAVTVPHMVLMARGRAE